MLTGELVGTVLDGKFQIERALGSGVAGDVYEAINLGLNARVAVKVLRPGGPQATDTRRKRFVREARVAARLRSEHAVRVLDVVAPERGATYIVMELLSGETLAERLRRTGALSAAKAVDLVLQAATALGEMHDAGIVHRDVKPSNLFLTRDDHGNERIKLLDFGIAAFQEPLARGEGAITQDSMLGTPLYMAPEQVRGSSGVDARADVWALGITFYELISGRPPFDGQTVLALLNQIENQEPRSLLEVCPDITPDLAALVQRCLSKDPAGRPANAGVFAAALSRIEGIPTVPTIKLRRRRRMLLPTAVAVAALLGLVGFALSHPAKAPAEPKIPEAQTLTNASPAAANPSSPTPDTNVADNKRPTAPAAAIEGAAPVPPAFSHAPAAHRTNVTKPMPHPTQNIVPLAPRKPKDDDRIE
jgi:serine/threonine-protein kinase